ncbi:hypothetical protein ACFV7R_24430 [Streptomyces sp. NPDC059866]|uniref:hypothetical protein n=1 Tax=Streptomyces sp. NPDC059866 TaxID=3346978 RepID=UPI0036523AC6
MPDSPWHRRCEDRALDAVRAKKVLDGEIAFVSDAHEAALPTASAKEPASEAR